MRIGQSISTCEAELLQQNSFLLDWGDIDAEYEHQENMDDSEPQSRQRSRLWRTGKCGEAFLQDASQ